MRSAADIAAEMGEGLQRLFEAGLELAMRIQADALAAEAPEARAGLAVSFHRVSRGVRQTAALRMKLAGDLKRFEREAGAEVVSLEAARARRGKATVRAEVQRLIWNEGGDEVDRENLTADLDELLDIELQDEAFLDQPTEAVIARICEHLGLQVPVPPPDSDRHGRACPGHPEAPSAQDDHSGATANFSETPAHLGPRDKPGDDGDEGGVFRSSA